MNNPRLDIHRSVYESWIETVEDMNYHRAYVSTIKDGVLESVQCMPGTKSVRNIRIT